VIISLQGWQKGRVSAQGEIFSILTRHLSIGVFKAEGPALYMMQFQTINHVRGFTRITFNKLNFAPFVNKGTFSVVGRRKSGMECSFLWTELSSFVPPKELQLTRSFFHLMKMKYGSKRRPETTSCYGMMPML